MSLDARKPLTTSIVRIGTLRLRGAPGHSPPPVAAGGERLRERGGKVRCQAVPLWSPLGSAGPFDAFTFGSGLAEPSTAYGSGDPR